jgi:hypothetical protein
MRATSQAPRAPPPPPEPNPTPATTTSTPTKPKPPTTATKSRPTPNLKTATTPDPHSSEPGPPSQGYHPAPHQAPGTRSRRTMRSIKLRTQAQTTQQQHQRTPPDQPPCTRCSPPPAPTRLPVCRRPGSERAAPAPSARRADRSRGPHAGEVQATQLRARGVGRVVRLTVSCDRGSLQVVGMGEVDSRVAIVTGVSRRRGIGFAIARRLLQDGLKVVIHSWSPHDADQPWSPGPNEQSAVIEELGGLGDRLEHVAADFADVDAPRRVIDHAAGLAWSMC